MKTIDQIRRDNAIALAAGFTTKAEFAKAIGRDDSLVGRYLKGAAKKFGDAMARHIEESLSLETGWMDNVHENSAEETIPTYSLEDAPICENEYLLSLPGGTIPDYNQQALFLCLKYDEIAREKAEYVVFRKTDRAIPVVCVQLGSKKQRNYLGELVGGRRVDRPELLHSLDSGEILCAIHSPKDDSHLWNKG